MIDHSKSLKNKEEEKDVTILHAMGDFLSEIIRTVFHHLDSRIALMPSDFLNSSFNFPSEPFPILNESLKGYLRFSLNWKDDEQSLEFVPLEKVEDYYPEEIEEEVILPYDGSNDRAAFHRKITSSYPSNLTDLTKPFKIDENNNNPIATDQNASDNFLPISSSQNSPIKGKPASVDSSSKLKSLKKIASKEEEDIKTINKRKVGQPTETKKYSTHKIKDDSIFQSATSSLRTDSAPNMKLSFKHRYDKRNLDQADFTPQVTDPNKKEFSYPNEYAPSSPLEKQEQPKKPPALRKTFSSTQKSSHINSDNDNSSSDKTISNPELKSRTSDSDSILHWPSILESDYLTKIGQRPKYTIEKSLLYNGEKVPSNLEKRSTTDENNKHHPTHGHSDLNDYERKRDLAHNPKDHDKQYSNLVSPSADKQRGNEKISSTIDSLNIHRIVDPLSPQDSDANPTNSMGSSKLQTPKKKKPTIRKAFDTISSISDSYNIITDTDRVVGSPAIAINRLDVTVVGDSRSSADIGNSYIESEEESSDETHHYFPEEGLASLNKSYLWKYKVKF